MGEKVYRLRSGVSFKTRQGFAYQFGNVRGLRGVFGGISIDLAVVSRLVS